MAAEPTSTGVTPRRWERFAPFGALGFLLSIVVGAVLVGETTPSSQASAREIAAYFHDHSSGILANTALVVLGAFALFPWFLGSLWRATRQAEGDGGICAVVALVAGVALLGPLLIQAAAWGAAALEAGPNRDPSVAAGLMDLGNMGFLLVPFPAAALIAATSLAGRPGVLLPTWLTRTGLPLAAVMVVSSVVVPGAAPVLFLLFGLWLVAVAFTLVRRGVPTGEPAEG